MRRGQQLGASQQSPNDATASTTSQRSRPTVNATVPAPSAFSTPSRLTVGVWRTPVTPTTHSTTATVHVNDLETLAKSHSGFQFDAFEELIHDAVDWGAQRVNINVIKMTKKGKLTSNTVCTHSIFFPEYCCC